MLVIRADDVTTQMAAAIFKQEEQVTRRDRCCVQRVDEQARPCSTCFLAGAQGHRGVQRGAGAHQPRADAGLRGSLDRGVGQRMHP